MMRRIAAVLAGLAFTLPTSVSAGPVPDGYKLEQVLMLSRHNIRAPLANNGSVLAKVTMQKWPDWEVPGGYLTVKGGVLETYMGRAVAGWLVEQGLLARDACPAPGSVYLYANSLQRTVATAQFFAAGAFPGCDVALHHQDKMGTMDPVFLPAFHDEDENAKAEAVTAMTARARQLQLTPGYRLLNTILGFKNSQSCSQDRLCDLTKGSDSFSAKKGEEPNTAGSLKLGNAVIDAFTLQYYEGFALKDIAWGKIRNDAQWQTLAAVKNGYQETLFTTPAVARDVARSTLAYITGAFARPETGKAVPVTLMFGHDSNIASVLAALEANSYDLPGQDEKTPIGGLIQFQRWRDTKGGRDLFRLDYVYQTKQQLREGSELGARNPPRRVTLTLKACPADANGFCPWSDFVKVLP
ncbi:bifunctional glucose-1-phosphatase/inositol phosphatase [Labrys neptuniae]